jgi:hypothetical protein
MEATADATRLARDGIIRRQGWEWRYPEGVLSDEERASIEARQFGRTLTAIDELPERP